MRIAIFNDFQRPIPPVAGGSVPTLIDIILRENEKHQQFDIDVYVCENKQARIAAKEYKHSNFIFVKDANLIRFLTNVIFKLNLPIKLDSIPLPFTIRNYYKKQKYDMVYIVGYIRGALSIIERSKAPCVIHHHVVTDILHEPSIKGEEIVNKATKICFVSDFAKNQASTGTDEQNAKMVTFPNVIDVEQFTFDNHDMIRKQIRSKYNIKDTDKVILFVGRMVATKGTLEVIEAFNKCGFDDSVKLLIAGGATYDSKKVTPYVKSCLDQANNSPNIIFTGYIPYSVLPRYYCASDVSTLISRDDEACGLVGIESMAAGLPLITTNRGGVGDYVSDDCKIVTPDDNDLVDNISKAMKTLVNDELLCEKMGKAGAKRAKKFDRCEYYKTFEKLVESVVDNK